MTLNPLQSWLLLLTGAGLLIALLWEITINEKSHNDSYPFKNENEYDND